MVIVKVNKKNEHIQEITISGHAGSGPAGYDLVCAGVSTVSFGLINAVYQLCNLQLLIEQRDEGGYLHIAFPEHVSKSQMEKAQLLLEGMIISFKSIEDQYSEYIKITYN